MADATRVELIGDERLKATLAIAAIRIQDMSSPGSRTASLIATRGRSGVPRLSGRLASTIAASADKSEATVRASTEYANRTHWGYARVGQAPQPFLTDPAHALEPVWTGFYQDRAEQVLGAVKGA